MIWRKLAVLRIADWRPLELTPELVQQVADLLGRQPRGLEDIPVSRPDGTPMVIRVASLVDDKPFPTLFWLIDPEGRGGGADQGTAGHH